MEFEGDESSYQTPKWSKPTNSAEFRSNSVQDSILKISSLPPELITEILSRLPVKSLLKFRSVSKSWFTLISSPEFMNTHLSICNSNKDQRHHRIMMGFYKDKYKLKDFSFRSLFDNPVTELSDLNYPVKDQCEEAFWVVGSVNGLICLVREFHLSSDLLIWNPSIRKYKELPDSRLTLSYCYCTYGFGYDEFYDDYKVVGIYCVYGSSPHVEIKIYSLKSDSWRKIQCLVDWMQFSSSSVFVKGKFHWTTNACDYNECEVWDIISFGLADENMGKVEQPCYGEGKSISELGVLGCDLCGFSHCLAIGVDVWVMKEYGRKESWTKMCTIEYPKLKRYLFSPTIFLSNNGDVLVGYGSTFIIYNPKDDSFKYPEVINHDYWRMGVIYIESLVSPFSTEGLRLQQKQCVGKLRSRQSSNK